MIALSIVEAIVLVVVATVISSIFEATANEVSFTFAFFISGWKNHLRMALLMLCAAVPIAYYLNRFVIVYVVDPINAMSFQMERYFETDEEHRDRKLPELDIHSGDEIERLYHSLQKMVGDMGGYIDRVLLEEQKSAHLTRGFMIALAKAVDAKDRYTSGHSARVAAYSREIAKRMGKTEEEQEQIYVMGLLHDIGKIGVPEAIINKNGRLTDEEFAKIKEHPGIGHEILKNVTELPGLATGARWHHERFGGGGYPDGLSGLDIPEEARIIAVADAYDAMTSNRAYSNVRPQEEVRAEIIRCKGSQFDPGIADIMVAMIDDDKEYKMREIF
ncbi:MAG: HD-GYP domain-containing protein [Lachnospiraceae bacterium]|nr:HD-GYP domain-containing protein [Lachnospiraceae bacterium]